jgi:hypothetical protein
MRQFRYLSASFLAQITTGVAKECPQAYWEIYLVHMLLIAATKWLDLEE